MKTTEQWLQDKLFLYKDDPKETLEDMLVTTTGIIDRFLKDPESKLHKGLLETCVEHHKLFLKEIGIII